MLKRVISGICLVAITAPALYFGGWFLYALCLVISLVGNFELLRVAGLEKSPLGICAYVATIAYYMTMLSPDHRYSILVLVAAFLAQMSVNTYTDICARNACGSISCADVGVCIHISKV